MRLFKALEEKNLDVRVRDRLLAEGKIKQEEVNKYLESLEDDQKNIDMDFVKKSQKQ